MFKQKYYNLSLSVYLAFFVVVNCIINDTDAPRPSFIYLVCQNTRKKKTTYVVLQTVCFLYQPVIKDIFLKTNWGLLLSALFYIPELVTSYSLIYLLIFTYISVLKIFIFSRTLLYSYPLVSGQKQHKGPWNNPIHRTTCEPFPEENFNKYKFSIELIYRKTEKTKNIIFFIKFIGFNIRLKYMKKKKY